MNQYTKRQDDFNHRRQHLNSYTEAALETRFWSLLEEIVTPLLDLAYSHTSPSIERSILLRMGFSSLEAQPLVDLAISHNLIENGVGHLVYVMAQKEHLSIREAGLALIEGQGWQMLEEYFEMGATL